MLSLAMFAAAACVSFFGCFLSHKNSLAMQMTRAQVTQLRRVMRSKGVTVGDVRSVST